MQTNETTPKQGRTLEEISVLFEAESAAHDAQVLERRLSQERGAATRLQQHSQGPPCCGGPYQAAGDAGGGGKGKVSEGAAGGRGDETV